MADRALCNVSGLELWAVVESGQVTGITNRAGEIERGETPQPMDHQDGSQTLPLHGSEPPFDRDHDYLVPTYRVFPDHVVRTVKVKRRGAA